MSAYVTALRVLVALTIGFGWGAVTAGVVGWSL